MFSVRLKELRKKTQLTQSEFARRFNISNGAIGNWESGKRQPDSETLSAIADFFHVSVDYLLGRTDSPALSSLDAQLRGIDFALFDEVQDMTEEQKQDILDYIKYKKSRAQ